MLENNIARPLRYFPVDKTFVITNGTEFFNRPLYGGNTAFRVDAGDKPEFSLYSSGRNGNVRLGLRTAHDSKWLNDAASVIACYRPGAMRYEITDPLLGNGSLSLEAIATRETEGLLLRAELRGATEPVELIFAFGGVNGERGRRDGDIGCERVPVAEFFQLRPEQCHGNVVDLGTNSFVVQGKPGAITGVFSSPATLTIADAGDWKNIDALLSPAPHLSDEPVVLARIALLKGSAHFIGLQRHAAGTNADEALKVYRDVAQPPVDDSSAVKKEPTDLWRADALPRLFTDEENLRRSVAERVVVETPDPFIDAAVASLNIAADAIWDDRQQSFMHGGVAWRVRLLGWRGAYAGDELGWHDRTRLHLEGYARQQNTDAVPPAIPPADASANLSRNEAALHSDGDLTKSHYDMNLVSIDAFFRHLLWTGDLEFARKMWPVVERHLAWERRLFRREFGPDQLPLYEAYCCIWASDDLAYEGGGATHASAYNFYHNQMAARVARMLGKDPEPYEREAALISKAMREELWLNDRGWFGEWKDLLGRQFVHPNAALWTFYHTVDSHVPTPLEAWQMSRFVDTQFARIPLHGPGVPEGNFTLPTTSWMPYTWSLNNVVLAESMHTALAYWQADRADAAVPLMKGALLDSMYLGLCPGNVGMCTYFDVYRHESQRDFGDGVGSLSRAIVEGLFGARPDILAGELKLHPGFPASWDHAGIQHPDFDFAFRRDGLRESYTVASRFPKAMTLRLQIAALRDSVSSVTVNGQPANWRAMEDSVGEPRIEIEAPAFRATTIVVEWNGRPPAKVKAPAIIASQTELRADCGAMIDRISDPQRALRKTDSTKNSFSGIADGSPGHRTVFAGVKQGELRWWQPVEFEIRPPWEILPAAAQDSDHLRFRIRNNTDKPVDRDVTVRADEHVSKFRLSASASGISDEIVLPSDGLVPGSNPIEIRFANEIIRGTVVNWKISASTDSRFETVPLTATFNDRVTQIFRNDYVSPRSPFCSLALPKQGIGSWCHPDENFVVDDSGLRAVAAQNAGRLVLPQRVPFETTADNVAKNILFTSLWTNYPEHASVPLAGKAAHVYLLMAGSSNPMLSRFDNGEVVITYADGSTARLALENPTTWWPIDQDYFIDDFAFRRPEPIPPRVDLKTGRVRVLDAINFKGRGQTVPGGAATVLDLPLDPAKELKSLTVRTLANEVVIGLMSVTLMR
jgi:hypothetical protein